MPINFNVLYMLYTYIEKQKYKKTIFNVLRDNWDFIHLSETGTEKNSFMKVLCKNFFQMEIFLPKGRAEIPEI